MIIFEQLMVARYQAEITKIKTTAFSDQDVINLILQRSEIIKDQTRSGKAVKDWTQGDATQLRSIAEKLGDELIYRAAGIIWLEYMEIFESIQTLSTLKVADIGCGYALFDYFLYDNFFKNRIRPGGGIILDVRAQRFENQKPILENYGTTKILTKAANGKAMRLFTVRGKDHSSSSRKTSA